MLCFRTRFLGFSDVGESWPIVAWMNNGTDVKLSLMSVEPDGFLLHLS